MLAQRHVGASAIAPDALAAYGGDPQAAPVSLQPGARLLWREVPWTVLHRSPSSVDLQCADGTSKVVTVPLAHLYHALTQFLATSYGYDILNRRVALQLRARG